MASSKPTGRNYSKHSYRTDPISRRVYYFRFSIFGCGYYSSNYPSNTPDKKIIKIFFVRFDIINKLSLVYISVKLLLMAPFYVWKVKIFRSVYYSTQGLTSPLGLDQVQVQVFLDKYLQVQVQVQVLIQVLFKKFLVRKH